MTVTAAAETLGVTRVALSSLLNGRASLSRQMALRLKAAFGADADELARLQEDSLAERRREEERKIAVRNYVPPFLKITAGQIHEWADKGEEARSRLPVLLRRLVRSTGHELRRVDFPGYGEAQRPGWDGWVETRSASRYIPKGRSGWELGTGKDPCRKANHDFKGPRSDLPEDVRADTTFVFVTSRKWPGKRDWEVARKAEGRWKDVWALDASDLEQWLEQSIEGQVWMAEELGLPSFATLPTDRPAARWRDCMTLDSAWREWSEASEPPMAADLFAPAVAEHRGRIASWLRSEPPDGPLYVAADSKEEALAFLACMFRDEDMLADFADLVVVVNSVQILRVLAPSTSRFVPIVAGNEAERELAALYRRRHCIVVRPRNAVDQDPDVSLGLVRHETFTDGLMAMGLGQDEIDRLSRVSGRSLTVLRRRLSRLDAIREPRWAEKAEVARQLVPLTLIGAWLSESMADRQVLQVVADRPADRIEEDVAALLGSDDCPVWSVGQHRGVVSKFDGLFAVGRYMTLADLRRFLAVAEIVLSEADPALELPRDRRWLASLHGKVRNHSKALRIGVGETLVLLSVHGNELFRRRLGIEMEAEVAALVRRLLRPEGDEAPLTAEALASSDRDLPMFAEAAPDEFLSVLEEDLRRPESAVRELLKPVEATIFNRSPGVGLLWALECLAWNPAHLTRVVLVLAGLSTPASDSHAVNRPVSSLERIFRSWMPQAAATLEQRVQVLRLLCGRVPEVGWHVCMKQLAPGLRDPSGNRRPRWRGDAAGAGQRVSADESRAFILGALDQALDWPTGYDASKLADLVDSLGAMPEAERVRVWSVVEDWLADQPDALERSAFRERLRRFAFAVRGPHVKVDTEVRKRARAMYERLLPTDLVARHAWLFARHWIEEWPEETGEARDWRWREERVQERRAEAMREILEGDGLPGALRLLPGSEAAELVGRHVARSIPCPPERVEAVRACLSGDLPAELDIEADKLGEFVNGFLFGVQEDAREQLLSSVADSLSRARAAFLFKWAPFEERTWRAVDRQGVDIATAYWREVRPHRGREFSEDERTELLERFLAAERPRAAFFALSLWLDSVETSRLSDLLMRIASGSGMEDGDLEINPYHWEKAIRSLNDRTGVPRDEMAYMEFAFFEALRFGDYGIPNLQRRLAESPRDFVRFVSILFERRDGRDDPEGWPVKDSQQLSSLRSSAYGVLSGFDRIPGTHGRKIRSEELRVWVDEVRRLGRDCGRERGTDFSVGKLLSKAPAEDDGLWPRRPVCEIMETIRSRWLMEGFESGAVEARGVAMRVAGDSQERDLADRYRRWADQLTGEFPSVGPVLEKIGAFYAASAAQWDSIDRTGERLGDFDLAPPARD